MEQYLYIKKSIAKHFVDFAEPLSAEEYNNLGETWEDYVDNKWVLLNDGQKAFYEVNPDATVKEVWDMELIPPHVRTLDEAKSEKIMEIENYDRSDNVNAFTVNGELTDWFTPEQRSSYKSSIDAAKLLGIESLSLFIGNTPVTISTQNAEYMLAQIQHYADQCFIVTKQHKLAVEGMESVEDVDGFDVSQGYPEKINFTIETV